MGLDWHAIDRFLMGEAWTGSNVTEYRDELCYAIGARWGGSAAERRAAEFIRDQMESNGLQQSRLEEFPLDTWDYASAHLSVLETGRALAVRPFLRCPQVDLTAPLVDAGYGTEREIARLGQQMRGAIAIMTLAPEPFTSPLPHTERLRQLAVAGAAAAIAVEVKSGGRMEYRSAGDWRDPGVTGHPLPTVITSREDGALLRREAGKGHSARVAVESRFFEAPSQNTVAELIGEAWPDEHIIVAGHHDTVPGTAGGNDNASGTIAVMETARVLARLKSETGVSPGRTIRFATWSGEEQNLQGAYAYVAAHHGEDGRRDPPRFALNLDELSTGHMKGVVLMFPHLRSFMQRQLDTMGDGLACHVQGPLDAHSDHFPFVRAGIQAGILWRWRFYGRHADAEFHHESGDSADKVNVRELKEYAGQISRLMLRLSHIRPEDWPENPVTAEQVAERARQESGAHVPTFW